ncbi:hypothetical protein [Helicobacter canis]|uniref:Uncharacterized protein n=1 Tax=Helicobacter canis NCTC 12740 TaxID=1357399 RepID=V8CL01_9HELI|nr:hypothetical protein [Helicobacter canis]ETD27777.1 hypothetical protein HMPREF2087_00698 [Helicobacter canis NCTC 12740]
MLNSDGFLFFTQLLESKSAWHGLQNLEAKRFFSLAGWNLALIAQFSLSPYAFMLGNACVLVAFGFRIYRVIKDAKNDSIDVFWDSVGLSALGYTLAFIALGMGSFHYFTPANILASLYLLFLLAR